MRYYAKKLNIFAMLLLYTHHSGSCYIARMPAGCRFRHSFILVWLFTSAVYLRYYFRGIHWFFDTSSFYYGVITLRGPARLYARRGIDELPSLHYYCNALPFSVLSKGVSLLMWDIFHSWKYALVWRDDLIIDDTEYSRPQLSAQPRHETLYSIRFQQLFQLAASPSVHGYYQLLAGDGRCRAEGLRFVQMRI